MQFKQFADMLVLYQINSCHFIGMKCQPGLTYDKANSKKKFDICTLQLSNKK